MFYGVQIAEKQVFGRLKMVDSRETCGTEEQRTVSGETEAQMPMRGYSFKMSAVILLLSAVCFFSLTAEAKYGGGTGEPNEPYLIYDASQMNAIGADSNDWDKCFKLMSNVDLSKYTGTEFNIIGEYVSYGNPKNKPFTGVFDGNGHTISNFTYASTGTSYIGLFGYVDDPSAEIKDLGLVDPNVDAGTGWYVGSLVGYNSGTITGCYVEGGSISGNGCVGGQVGYNYRAIITNCYSTGSVSGTTDIGGLVGYNSRAITTNCYSTGSVSGTTDIGGLVGRRSGGEVNNSFWDIETSGQATSAGGTGLTTAEMQMASTFVDWACDAFWTIDEGVDYPRLWWQNMPGEPITTPFYGVGNGTEADPHLIYTAEQLNTFGLFPCLRGKHFKLMADIDLSGYTGTEFDIIGDVYDPFTGVFDGNGHTISNFKYDCNGVNSIGLFGYVKGSDVEIKDLGLLEPNIDAGSGSSVGSLVGWFYSGNLSNCYVRGGRVAGNQSVGGLVGLNYGTITRCSSSGIAEGSWSVGGLIGRNIQGGAITDCYSEGSVDGIDCIGGLVGYNLQGAITDCYSEGSVDGNDCIGGLVGSTSLAVIIENCYATGNVAGEVAVGGLVGHNYYGKISDCSATGTVEGTKWVGGLVGYNTHRSTISNCCWVGDRVAGATSVGGLAGYNGWSYLTAITNCFAEAGSVEGKSIVGGLVGWSDSKITYCYSMASVSGGANVGGLVGYIYNSKIDNCYSAGEVYGDRPVGGLVGLNAYSKIYGCFWDIETSGQTDSDGGTGKNTDEMQTMSTFSWDFTTPLWTIDEGVDYPRLWWEFVPVLGAEPEVTLGTSNIISWDPIPGVNDFYAECAEDADFTSIVYNSGWISETSFEFTGLEVGRQYWYSVKARNGKGEECQWSNVETSLQGTLADVVEMKLGPESLKNNNMQNSLLNKIDAAEEMIDQGLYEDALNKLENDILAKTDGCSETGEPDKNDWIITCEEQAVIYPLVMDTIEHVRALMVQELD
jgi:hypothetical protein